MNSGELSQITELAKLFQFSKILLLLAGIVCLGLLVNGVERVAAGVYKRFPARRLLISQIVSSLNFSIYIFGGIFLFFAVIRPPRELMLAAIGSAAVAFGFAIKDLVGSVVAGLILLFDRPFQVGDRVAFGDVYGEIQSIGLRTVRLVTLDDSVVTIPNHRFFTDVVSSANAGALDMMVTMDFHVAIGSDIALARDLLHETVVTSRFVYLKKPVSVVIEEVPVAHRLAIRLKAKAYVLDVRFEKAFVTDVFLRATEAFERRGIRRPTVSWEENGHGSALNAPPGERSKG